MVDKDKLICPYCKGDNSYVAGKVIHTNDLKPIAGYTEPTIGIDYLNIFILKEKEDKYAGLMIENINGTRYINIRYCPFCGRKLYKDNVKREVE